MMMPDDQNDAGGEVSQIQVETKILGLECEATVEEQAEAGVKLSQAVMNRDSVAQAARESAREYRERLNGFSEQISRLARGVKGQVTREVECRIEWDYSSGTVTTIRVDTGEIVNQRPITDEERQIGMIFKPINEDGDHEEQMTPEAEPDAERPSSPDPEVSPDEEDGDGDADDEDDEDDDEEGDDFDFRQN